MVRIDNNKKQEATDRSPLFPFLSPKVTTFTDNLLTSRVWVSYSRPMVVVDS